MLPSAQFFLALGAALFLASLTWAVRLFGPAADLSRRRLAEGWTPRQLHMMAIAWAILVFSFVDALAPASSLWLSWATLAISVTLALGVSRRSGFEFMVWGVAAVAIDLTVRARLADLGLSS
jgi:hypothetical protein